MHEIKTLLDALRDIADAAYGTDTPKLRARALDALLIFNGLPAIVPTIDAGAHDKNAPQVKPGATENQIADAFSTIAHLCQYLPPDGFAADIKKICATALGKIAKLPAFPMPEKTALECGCTHHGILTTCPIHATEPSPFNIHPGGHLAEI